MKVSQALYSKSVPVRFLLAVGLLAQVSTGLAGGVVTTFTQGALQTALVGGGTVTFGGSGTITLSSTLSITQDTTIDASGYQVTISGGNAVRLFQVTNATFRVNGLTLADGRFVGTNGASGQVAAGGCLFNLSGTVSLTACILTNHFVQGGNGGTGGYGGDGLGGAIYSSGGHLNLTNCRVLNCTAVGGMGIFYANPSTGQSSGGSGLGRGGALCAVDSSLNLVGGTLANNSVVGGPAQGDVFNRGGDAWAGALFASNSLVYAATTVLSGNTAVGGSASQSAGGGSGNGGALLLTGTSQAVFNLCVFSANSATGGSFGGGWSSAGLGLGGAVFNLGQFQARNCTFQGNVAAGSATPSYNAQPGQGGAVYSTLSTVLTGCTFSGNTAQGGAGSYYNPGSFAGGPGEGGAVWSSGTLAATNSTWSGNRAAGGGYPYYVERNYEGWGEGDALGGALYLAGGMVTLMNVSLANNYAGPDPGLAVSGLAQGGAIMNTNSTVLLRGSLLAYNCSRTMVTSCSNVWGTVTDGGYNLSSDTTGGFTALGSRMNTDPLLSALGNHGGPTATLWLLPGSPARDQIPSGFPLIDQRGAPRPQGAGADMGAVEANDLPVAPFAVASGQTNGNLTFTFPATDTWRAYRLLASGDLVTWTSIATNSPLSTGPVQFSQPLSGAQKFFRVVTP